MKNCVLWSPAYASLSKEERQRADKLIWYFSRKLSWNISSFPSANGPLEPGHWLDAKQRIDELRTAWSTDILWAMRGGYGCVHLLEALAAFPGNEAPLLIGYSDITVLQSYWQRRHWGPSGYAAMPALPAAERAITTLCNLLSGNPQSINSGCLKADESLTILRQGQVSGPVFAGCLSVLGSLIGGPAMPKLSGHILCIEDIDERPYAIDRMLWQLYHAGQLDDLLAVIGGRFPVTDHPNPGRGPSLHQIMEDWAQRLEIPFAYGLPFGHDDDPIALPCGGYGDLSLTKSWDLSYTLYDK